MNKERLYNILNSKEIYDIYYAEEPIWIQEIRDNFATVGFLNGAPEKDVCIEDLYENDF